MVFLLVAQAQDLFMKSFRIFSKKENLIVLFEQAIRFGVVGLLSNLILYALFLLLVRFGFDSKGVVTILYLIGLFSNFIFNRRWSFRHHGSVTKSGKRYFFLYGFMYLINIFMLWVFVDKLCLSPAIVQACVVIVFIPLVFIMQRFWVFSSCGENMMARQEVKAESTWRK